MFILHTPCDRIRDYIYLILTRVYNIAINSTANELTVFSSCKEMLNIHFQSDLREDMISTSSITLQVHFVEVSISYAIP